MARCMSVMDYRTALSILGISDTATTSISKIRKAYLRRALELHPDRQRTDQDRQRANEAFVRLREAYEMVLMDQYPESTKEDVDLTRAFFPQGDSRAVRPNDMFGIDLTVPFDPHAQMDDEQRARAESLLREWLEEEISCASDDDASSSSSASSSLG
eukprot:CAMPEP_0118798388 /NCGR_PEP_ID=MMETSP1161-20130426/799_1 /TAXON_ID=249345 /ORGANISM="Picochlorum oklahomensis, Strain CCMP2329" /LENGTH=156 /DNA_ID=CAMNT_0006725799 /DNA_START=135 /DNA_END=605 /DNA_ORIENTATION=-